jgi:hypothetical protein
MVTMDRKGIIFCGGMMLYKQHKDAVMDALAKATGQSLEDIKSKDRATHSVVKIEYLPAHSLSGAVTGAMISDALIKAGLIYTDEYCINCGGDHEATSQDCLWYLARGKPQQMKELIERKQQNTSASRQARTSAQRFTTPSALQGPQQGASEVSSSHPPQHDRTGIRFVCLNDEQPEDDFTIQHE